MANKAVANAKHFLPSEAGEEKRAIDAPGATIYF
jgi:hypothetical protein